MLGDVVNLMHKNKCAKEAYRWLKERQEEAQARAKRAFQLDAENYILHDPEKTASLVLKHYGENRQEEAQKYADDPMYWIEKLEDDLFDDIFSVEGVQSLAPRCAVAFIPDIQGNAIVKKVSNEYAIAVNLGVFWTASMLVQAVLLEADENCHTDLPELLFKSAIRAFETREKQIFKQEINYCRFVDTLENNVKAGFVGSVVLRFIGWHELAHIQKGHADLFSRSLLIDHDGVKTSYPKIDGLTSNQKHVAELEADRLALKYMLSGASSTETAWNNMLFIYAYFAFLQHLEERKGSSICPDHPSPIIRAEALYSHCAALIGGPSNDAFVWIKAIFNAWRKLFMSEVMFTVRTESPEEILGLFNGETELNAVGLKIHLLGSESEHGMNIGEVVFNFAISFVSGVPASMLATYLCEKFSKNGENIVRVNSKLVKDVEDLKIMIQKLIDEKEED